MTTTGISQHIGRQGLLSSALAAVSSLWVLLLGTAPMLAAQTVAGAAVLYATGSLICHQRPERSFSVAGAQLPVCARCYGLYLGIAVGALVWAVVARRRRTDLNRGVLLAMLAIVGAPTAVTVLTAGAGVFDPPNIWRAALALPLGVVAGVAVGAAASGHLK